MTKRRFLALPAAHGFTAVDLAVGEVAAIDCLAERFALRTFFRFALVVRTADTAAGCRAEGFVIRIGAGDGAFWRVTDRFADG